MPKTSNQFSDAYGQPGALDLYPIFMFLVTVGVASPPPATGSQHSPSVPNVSYFTPSSSTTKPDITLAELSNTDTGSSSSNESPNASSPLKKVPEEREKQNVKFSDEKSTDKELPSCSNNQNVETTTGAMMLGPRMTTVAIITTTTTGVLVDSNNCCQSFASSSSFSTKTTSVSCHAVGCSISCPAYSSSSSAHGRIHGQDCRRHEERLGTFSLQIYFLYFVLFLGVSNFT